MYGDNKTFTVESPDKAVALRVTQFRCHVELELLNLQSPGVIDSLPVTAYLEKLTWIASFIY